MGYVIFCVIFLLALYLIHRDNEKKAEIKKSYRRKYEECTDLEAKVQCGRAWLVSGHCSSDDKRLLYWNALDMIGKHEQGKYWALETGRAYHASLRGGHVTAVDEAIIQNDINARL